MMNITKTEGCLFVVLVGILSVVLVSLGIFLAFGGHGVYTPLIIITSPLIVLGALDEKLFIAILFLVPFQWMGEVLLALRHNKYCLSAFLISVLGRYIYVLLVILFDGFGLHELIDINDDLLRFLEWWAGGWFVIITLAAIIYIGIQVFIWILLIKTWQQKK